MAGVVTRVIAAVAVILALCASGEAPTGAAVFLTPPEASLPTLSPAGGLVATVVSADADEVEIVDLPRGLPIQTVKVAGAVEDLRWADEERLLITAQSGNTLSLVLRNRRVTLAHPGRKIVVLNVRTGEQVQLFGKGNRELARNGRAGEVVNLLPHDPAHVLATGWGRMGLDLWRVELATGKADIVERGGNRTFAWYVDRGGRAVMRADHSRTGRTVVFRGRARLSTWRKLRAVRVDDDHVEGEFWPIAPTDDPALYHVLARPDGAAHHAIWSYDIEKNQLVAPVLEAGDADIASAITDRGTGALMGGLVARDTETTTLIDPALDARMRLVEGAFPRANVRYVSGRRDGRYLLAEISAPNRTPAYYAYDETARTIGLLYERHPKIAALALADAEIVPYEARDGTMLSAYVTHPLGVAADEPAPLVLMIHGGPYARDHFDFTPEVQAYAARGFRVVQPYFRGSTGKGRSFEEVGYRQWGRLMQTDAVDAAIAWQARGLATPEETCAVGGSYGGYAALMAGALTPEFFACVASTAGVSDLVRFVAADEENRGEDSEIYAYRVETVGHHERDAAALRQASPITYAATYPLPVFLAHGTEDARVLIEQSRAMRDALQAAGRPVEYHEYDGERHAMSRDVFARNVDQVADFVQRHAVRSAAVDREAAPD